MQKNASTFVVFKMAFALVSMTYRLAVLCPFEMGTPASSP
jgi:hypothetical protein